ncbi:MAG: hypothetical protein IPL55_03265 [Saprospiraceae bacterium]|jgi:hypothetical protein|nr:hypothetical protein [Saprospiraceae bacterium]
MVELKNISELLLSIKRLEELKSEQRMVLKFKMNDAYQSTKPINLIRNTLKEASETISINDTIISSGLSLAAGYLSEKLISSKKISKTKKVIGSVMMMVLSNIISNNAESIKNLGSSLISLLKANRENKQRNEKEEFATR